MALDDLYTALDRFKSANQELQLQRTISGANDAVQQIRTSELKEDEKTNQLRGVAEKLTYTLASQGVPASTLEALTKYVPREAVPQSAEQAVILGTPDQRDRGQQLIDDKGQRQMELLQAKMDGMASVAQTKADAKGDAGLNPNQLATLNEKFSKFVQPDASVRSALGQATLNKQRAENLRTLVGGDLSEESLNKVPKSQLGELAIGMATLVKNGVASEGEVKMIFPETMKMDKAQMATYLEGAPQPANSAGFVHLYMKTIQREQAQAQSQMEESVISRANGHAYVKADPEGSKIKLSKLLGVSPEDVIVGPNGSVTTAQKQADDTKFDTYVKAAETRYKAAKGGDAKAAEDLKKLGIDAKTMTLPQIRNEIRFQIKQGNW